jgi:hypothetical protein
MKNLNEALQFFNFSQETAKPTNLIVTVDQLALQLVLIQLHPESHVLLFVFQDASATLDTLKTTMADVFFQLNAPVSQVETL